MSILPSDEAAAIVRHYIKTLTERSGLRWTPQNDADFDRLAELLGDAQEEFESIPPYQPPIYSDRQTVVLDNEPEGWADFDRWRAQRDTDDARRMLRREGGAR